MIYNFIADEWLENKILIIDVKKKLKQRRDDKFFFFS